MSKLVNASPEEIRKYFKGRNIRWVETFKNNNVPDEILLEFKDRIISGDCYSRVDAIINMMINNNRKMPKELFNFINAKLGITRLYNINDVYDLVEYLSNLSKDEFERKRYVACDVLSTIPNVPLEFAKLALEGESDLPYLHKTLDTMLSNRELEILPEVYDYVTNFLKNIYQSNFLLASSYVPGNIETEIFTVEEYVSLVPQGSIVSFFDFSYQGFTPEDLLKSAFNTESVIEIVVDKLLNVIEAGHARPLSNHEWKNTKALIKDHPKFKEISDAFTSQVEVYSHSEISWDEADKLIEAGKMKSDVLEIVLLRLDAPLWFTDKYQSKILQIMARRTRGDDVRSQFLEMMTRSRLSHDCGCNCDDNRFY